MHIQRIAERSPSGSLSSTRAEAVRDVSSERREPETGPAPIIRDLHFSSPLQHPGSKRVDLPLPKSGTARLPFELDVSLEGDPARISAELWTNANDHATNQAYAVPMRPVGRTPDGLKFRGEIEVRSAANYFATARVIPEPGAAPVWLAAFKNPSDINFRPRDVAHDRHNIMLVNVGMANCDSAQETYGTFEDMMSEGSPATNGKYTLSHLEDQGVTMVWLQGLFPPRPWQHGEKAWDRAGSPYAIKDFFSIRPELSASARGLEGGEARAAALRSFRAFKADCEARGMSLAVDVPFNHVGHNYEIADLFVGRDAAGHETREVRYGDLSQLAFSPEHAQKLQADFEAASPKFMEYVAPFMYVSKSRDTAGAASVHDTIPGGFFEWPDTKQLNHGRIRDGWDAWHDAPLTPATERVRGWIGRVLEHMAVDLDIQAVRLDHLAGMPEHFLRRTVNEVQAVLDRLRPGKRLYLIGEDFNTQSFTRHWLDNEQGGFFREFRSSRDPAKFRSVIDNPWRHDLLALGSHDEERAARVIPDRGALSRMTSLLHLIGGPVVTTMGDEFAEEGRLLFCQYRGWRTFDDFDPSRLWVAELKARAGKARLALDALQGAEREWLRTVDGPDDRDILAASRLPRPGPVERSGDTALLFANFSDVERRAQSFRFGARTREAIDADTAYQVFDLMGEDRERGLWGAPKSGRELLERGIHVELDPYQVQCLDLRPC